jgi:soluble lytic murein transglycosylase-like protein
VSQGERPKEIPREALAYRDNFIRIWRFYFAYAESPTIGFAQVHQESAWKADARSVYASGLAQFTPATAADYSRLLPAEVQATCPHKTGCPTDPNWALHALSLYDYNLHHRLDWAETPDDRWRLALAAYNGGAGWIIRERAKANNSARWSDIADACMRRADFCKENREYPVRILENWRPLYQRWLGL